MVTKKIDGFGILRGVDEDAEAYGEMQALDEDDIGRKFALSQHRHNPDIWEAVGYEGTWGREGEEWEITSRLE